MSKYTIIGGYWGFRANDPDNGYVFNHENAFGNNLPKDFVSTFLFTHTLLTYTPRRTKRKYSHILQLK
jgi:hypothetical protein